jgi:carnitine monooxygenase subunit
MTPETQPRTLPSELYVSEEHFRAEHEKIFRKAWLFAGHVSQAERPGDFFTLNLCGEPVAVARGADSSLHAFINVCRHRASLVVQGEGCGAKRFQCPYHGWLYALDGSLMGASHRECFPGLGKSETRLPPLRAGELGGLIFVNFDPEAEPLETYFGDLGESLDRLGLREMRFFRKDVSEADPNWKLFMDNFLESYHFPYAHPGLSRLYAPRQFEIVNRKRHVWFNAPLNGKLSSDRTERWYQRLFRPLRAADGGPAMWNYAWVWPNLLLDFSPEMMQAWTARPEAPARTVSTRLAYVPKRDTWRFRLLRRLNDPIQGKVAAEDLFLVRNVQAGIGSRTYSTGLLGMEGTGEHAVRHFHDMVREAMGAGTEGGA